MKPNLTLSNPICIDVAAVSCWWCCAEHMAMTRSALTRSQHSFLLCSVPFFSLSSSPFLYFRYSNILDVGPTALACARKHCCCCLPSEIESLRPHRPHERESETGFSNCISGGEFQRDWNRIVSTGSMRNRLLWSSAN